MTFRGKQTREDGQGKAGGGPQMRYNEISMIQLVIKSKFHLHVYSCKDPKILLNLIRPSNQLNFQVPLWVKPQNYFLLQKVRSNSWVTSTFLGPNVILGGTHQKPKHPTSSPLSN